MAANEIAATRKRWCWRMVLDYVRNGVCARHFAWPPALPHGVGIATASSARPRSVIISLVRQKEVLC